MNKLITKLQEILTEKGKLKATDIVKGNTIFGINGDLEEIKENTMLSGGKFSTNSPYHAVIISNTRDKLVRKNGSIQLSDEEISSHIGLTADKVLEGQSIMGVNGTAKGYIDPATTEDYATCMSIINDILGIDQDPVNSGMTENDVQP